MSFHHYNGKSLVQVRNLLIRKGAMSVEERHKFLDELKEWRSKQRSQAAVTRHFRKVWADFAKPLITELRKVQIALYYKGSPKRSVALLQYQELLQELHDLYQGFSHGNRSPKEIAQRNNLPNGGAHWTDWIPQDEKERINNDFQLAREKGRKVYQTFPRKGAGDKD